MFDAASAPTWSPPARPRRAASVGTFAAADLSKRYEASVTIAHVFELLVGLGASLGYGLPQGYAVLSPQQIDDVMREYEKSLADAKRAAEAAGALNVTTKQLQGPPAIEIVAFAEAGAFDLIVMGTHGRTGIGHLLLGSVAERVLRLAPCPVLTVRSSESSAASA